MKKATTPQLPVSKKFYTALTLRIADTCRLLPDGADLCNTPAVASKSPSAPLHAHS